MNNKIIIAIVVVAVIVLGGYFLLKSPMYKAPSSNLAPQTPSQEKSSAPTTETPAPITETPPLGSTDQALSGQNIVTYTDLGYSPSALRVKAGATVVFQNNSSRSMWTASAVHPAHTIYPTTGGCIGSTFDTCKGIQPDSFWSFKFNIAGAWKYHNHLNPSDTGAIVVE